MGACLRTMASILMDDELARMLEQIEGRDAGNGCFLCPCQDLTTWRLAIGRWYSPMKCPEPPETDTSTGALPESCPSQATCEQISLYFRERCPTFFII